MLAAFAAAECGDARLTKVPPHFFACVHVCIHPTLEKFSEGGGGSSV